jgi:hypothetical protein
VETLFPVMVEIIAVRETPRVKEAGMSQVIVAPLEEAPETPPCRPFRLTDAMILTAGAAIWLSGGVHLFVLLAQTFADLCRHAWWSREYLPERWPRFWHGIHDDVRNTLWYGVQLAFVALFGMTPAYVILRLIRPRPPLLALLRQPGMVAALSMIFGLFWGTGWLLMLFPRKVDSLTAAPAAAGGAVALAWVVLAMSRQWKSEPGWIDRLGRILGIVAIGTALVGLVIFRI